MIKSMNKLYKDFYYKNEASNNRYKVGLFTGLFIACLGAFILNGIDILDIYSSITSSKDAVKDRIPLQIVFGIASVLTYFLKRKFVRDVYNKVERDLDD